MKIAQLKVKGLLLLLLVSTSVFGQSNEGTNFWFSFMEHRDVGENNKVAMITSKVSTSGTVNIPNYNWSQGFTVQANAVTLVSLPSFVENIGSEMIDDIGIQLSSQDPVSLYIHQYFNFRSEATLVLPKESLGQSYHVMSYRGVSINGSQYRSEFLIVPTEDDTNISITLSDQTLGGQAEGAMINVNLNAGETYQVQALSSSGDLTGTYIEGDKDFAVFSGNSWTEVPSNCEARDNLLEQMFPVDTWGRQVVTVPMANTNFDVFRVQASENDTEVNVYASGSNISVDYFLDAGEHVEYQRSTPTYIQANQPIQVAQYNVGTGCNGNDLGDPSMVLLNSVEQTRDTVTLYNSTFQNITQNFINIIVATDDLPFITLDGAPIPTNAVTGTVGLNDEFTFVRLQVTSGSHTIISEACGVIATAYGYGQVESYAYSGGASFKPINANPIPEGACLNDSVYFDPGLSEARYSFLWDLGNGVTSTEAEFAYYFPDLGSYPVEVIITDECLGTKDTLNGDVQITLRQAVEAAGDTLICEGESFSLSASDLTSARFEWSGPQGYFSEEQFPTVNNTNPQMSGTYEVIGVVSGCATFPIGVEIDVRPNPTPNLGPDTIFCNRNGGETSLRPGNYMTYLWQDGTDRSSYQVLDDGIFWVEVTDNNACVGADSVLLRQICPTKIYLPNVFSPNFDGTNDYFQVQGNDIIRMRLQVFDRWGATVFETRSPEGSWDGTFKGKELNPGVFTWLLEVEGYREDGSLYDENLSGSVTLLK